jgi:hypothetical protein
LIIVTSLDPLTLGHFPLRAMWEHGVGVDSGFAWQIDKCTTIHGIGHCALNPLNRIKGVVTSVTSFVFEKQKLQIIRSH